MTGAGPLSASATSDKHPNHPDFLDLDGLAARVVSGSRLAVGGHHFARLPIALLRAVCDDAPRDLNYFSWGGGLPLEMLLEAKTVGSIDLCFSSLDIFGLPPRFRAVAEAGGMRVSDWPALAMIQGLRAAEENLPFMPLQLPEGSDMAELCPGLTIHVDPATGRRVGLIPAQRIDTLLLHAPRADEAGNVAIYGATALDLALVGAARQVLVTVEDVVPCGELQRLGWQTSILRNRISAIAKVPGGAWPASCLPDYATDYAALHRSLGPDAGPLRGTLAAGPDKPPARLRAAAGLTPGRIDPASFAADAPTGVEPPSIDEILACRLAAMLDNECFASAGAVSPLANVAYRLAKASHAPEMILATFSCGHLDIDPGVMSLTLLESMDAASAVAHAGGDESYSTFYQAGLTTHEIIGAAQVDAMARTNNLRLTRASGDPLRLAGQGGMSDVANMHRDMVLYVTRHEPRSLVESVDVASSGRGLVTASQRRAAGYRPGHVRVLTDLCLFELNEQSLRLVVTETMPGVSRAEIVEKTGFEVRFHPDCRPVAPPTAETLTLLRTRIDPLGLRRLEFVGARDRGPLLHEIIARDSTGVAACINTSKATTSDPSRHPPVRRAPQATEEISQPSQ